MGNSFGVLGRGAARRRAPAASRMAPGRALRRPRCSTRTAPPCIFLILRPGRRVALPYVRTICSNGIYHAYSEITMRMRASAHAPCVRHVRMRCMDI